MDGQQVAEGHRPQRLLLPCVQLPGVHHHRNRGGDSLVAAAGDDDDRLLAAAHPGVGPGGSHVSGPDLHILAVVVAQHLADVGPPLAGHALLGDGPVVVDLPLHQLPDILQVHGVREVHNGLHCQAAPVCQAAGLAAGGQHLAGAQQRLAVFLNEDDVGVVVGNPQPHLVLPRPQGQDDVEHHVPLGGPHLDLMVGKVVPDGVLLLPGDAGDHLQDLSRVPGHRAGGGRGLDALQAAGVGHNDALDVLDDVAAGLHQHLVRQTPQDLPRLGRAVGDGDGLGAPHGGHQLLLQNLEVGVVLYIRLVHFAPPLQCLHYTGKTARGQTLAADCVLWYDKKAARGRIPMRPQKCKRFDRRKSDVQSGMFRF